MGVFGASRGEVGTSTFYDLMQQADGHERVTVGYDDKLSQKGPRFAEALRQAAQNGHYILRVTTGNPKAAVVGVTELDEPLWT